MNKDTVKRIRDYSIDAKEVFEEFLKTSPQANLFRKYFHLRPTSSGVTIVSTLPDAPMRGISTTSKDDLKDKLSKIHTVLNKLVSDDYKLRRETLSSLGFKNRGTQTWREEDAQAAFIRGMITEDPVYEGIQFVASELCLEQGNRFDVVGLKNNTLYLFELKRDRTTIVADQAQRYYNHVNDHRSDFDMVLSVYPNLANVHFDNVKTVVVMRRAENSPRSKWENYSRTSNVDVWLFEQSISFEKVQQP